jgi:hypothetical protein
MDCRSPPDGRRCPVPGTYGFVRGFGNHNRGFAGVRLTVGLRHPHPHTPTAGLAFQRSPEPRSKGRLVHTCVPGYF